VLWDNTRAGESPGSFDFWVLLMSLPHHLGTVLESLPRKVPYLRPPPDRIQSWGLELSRLVPSGLRVGLIWAGDRTHPNDHNRSIPTDRLEILAGLPPVTLISVQKDELPPPGFSGELLSLGDRLTDLAETGAVMESLDLVISVDTAPAHLAGALGRPAWTLLPWVPDWRWLLGRKDSPWYPTMRLFRQPVRGDWDAVLLEVRSELVALTEVTRAR
jgi:hypothetical protein